MGVKIKMVTGDALAIAKETAKKLDMGTNILDAASLGDSKKQETTEVAESIETADGFAQVFPEHKFHIVDVLQKRGHIVGMTGDGVNDAPALKKADCGIAVSGATDAARAAAAIVLLTPGLSVIIDAIKESRRIFQRMNSYAIYRIAETLRVLFFMTLAILIFNFYPLTAVMIVMLALLNDGAILSIAYDNVHYKDKPEAWNMRMVLGISTALGVIGVVSAFGLFYLGERVFHLDRAHIQTAIIERDVRSTMRPRFKWRPYVLRAFFDTQLLIAESRGKIAHDFRVFFMGHKGSIEAKYTTNKSILPKTTATLTYSSTP